MFDVLLGPDGREIEDVAVTAALALKEACWCISQDALEGVIKLDQWIEVRNEDGEPVHRVDFTDAVTIGGEAAAAMG